MKIRPPQHTILPEIAFTAVALWHAALAITGATASLTGWTSEYLLWSLNHLAWAVGDAWVVLLLRDNRRLRTTPFWKASNEAWKAGYRSGARGTR